MDFCNICDNMLYIKYDNEELQNYCKNCNNIIKVKTNSSMIIIENNYDNDDIDVDNSINTNIKYDPTLPRVNNIKCPNKKCSKTADKDNEVIYSKYDKENLKFIYYCVHCEHFWKN
jgi:DNA-directed RNA polymerase subunit M/transcription elongation factor TFIIS